MSLNSNMTRVANLNTQRLRTVITDAKLDLQLVRFGSKLLSMVMFFNVDRPCLPLLILVYRPDSS